MKPWRLGMKVVCVDTDWHISLPADNSLPRRGQVLTVRRIDWDDRQAEHSRCGLQFEETAGHKFCDCHFRPAVDPPIEKVTRRAPSPARELEAA